MALLSIREQVKAADTRKLLLKYSELSNRKLLEPKEWDLKQAIYEEILEREKRPAQAAGPSASMGSMFPRSAAEAGLPSIMSVVEDLAGRVKKHNERKLAEQAARKTALSVKKPAQMTKKEAKKLGLY